MKQPVLQVGGKRMCVALASICNFLGLLLLSAAAYAQATAVTQPSLSYREEMDYMFQPLDKSKVPSGILYDRIFPLADVTDFTGTSIQDTTDSEHWFQAYYQFYQASYNTTGKLPSHQVRNAVDASYSPNILPIGIMRYKYDVLDSLAVDKNLMYVQNGQLHDVAGRTLSPYITKTIFMATPLYTSSQQYLSVGTTTLKLAPNLIFNNTGTAFTAYRVNFNDGRGELPISANGTVSVNYTTPGKRFITIIAYISTTRYYCKTELDVQGPSSVAYRMMADAICSGPPLEIPITGALPFSASAYGDSESKAATGKAYLYFAQANCADRGTNVPLGFQHMLTNLPSAVVKGIKLFDTSNQLDPQRNLLPARAGWKRGSERTGCDTALVCTTGSNEDGSRCRRGSRCFYNKIKRPIRIRQSGLCA